MEYRVFHGIPMEYRNSPYKLHRFFLKPPWRISVRVCCAVSKLERLKHDWDRKLKTNFAPLTPPPLKIKGRGEGAKYLIQFFVLINF